MVQVLDYARHTNWFMRGIQIPKINMLIMLKKENKSCNPTVVVQL